MRNRFMPLARWLTTAACHTLHWARLHTGSAPRSLALLWFALCLPATLQAATYTFPGALPSACSGSNGTYTCTAGYTPAEGDSLVIASPKPATITFNGDLQANNIQINTGGSAADLTLVVKGKLTLTYHANLNANITANSVVDKDGQATVGGKLTATAGGIDLLYNTAVNGAILASGNISLGQGVVAGLWVTSTAGTVSTDYQTQVKGAVSAYGAVLVGESAKVTGDVLSSNGSITLKYGATVGGQLNAKSDVTLAQASVVSGAISSWAGNVDAGYGTTLKSSVAAAGTLNFAQNSAVTGCVNATASSTITLGASVTTGGVCCGATSTCGQACVANNSGQALPAACSGPVDTSTITFVAYADSGNTSNSASLPLKVPSGTTSNDVMFAVVSQKSNNTLSAPAGWTQVLVGTANNKVSSSLWYRVATSADVDGKTYTFGSDKADDLLGGITTFRGVNISSPVVASGWTENLPSSTSAIAPSVNSTVSNTMLLAYWGTGDTAISGLPTGMTGTVGAPGGKKNGGVNQMAAYKPLTLTGQTGTRVATLNDKSASNGLLLSLRPGGASSAPAGPDHYELTVPATSLTCAATTVTVTACANNTSPCTSGYTNANGASASLSTAGATLGSGTVTFNAAGVATTTLSYPGAANGTAVSVTLSGESVSAQNPRQCCTGNGCSTANSCSTAFNTAGLMFATSANGTSTATLANQIAGTASATYYLRAVQTNTTTKACEAALTGANSVNWAHQCMNPGTCATGSLMTVSASSAVAIAGNPGSGVSSYTSVPMVFDANGNAPFSFSHADVGQTRFWVSKTLNSATLSGTSNALVTKPASLAITAVRQTASPGLANPAAATATDAKFVKAGEAFSATVTALTSGGAATPSFGHESTPESVSITPSLVLPAGGTTGTVANATVAGGLFTGGAATVSNLAYSEVGVITLTPGLSDGDYLGAGAVAGTSTGNVGRFIPHHFELTAGTPSPACGPLFSYFGQDGLTTPFTVTARNAANATTRNYAGSLAKLDLAQWASFGFSASGLPTASALSAGATAPSGSWLNGEASVSARHLFSRPATPVAPASVSVLATPVDSDGVTVTAATAVGAATGLRWGRLRLSNAFGRANSALQVPVVAEFWSGNVWQLNSADSCTALAAASVALSNPRSATGAVSTATTSAGALAITAGSGLITFAAPSPAGSSLSLDVALNLGSTTADLSCLGNHPSSTGGAKAWLRAQNGSCAATADRDPAGRISFGIFSPETRKTVHVRDLF